MTHSTSRALALIAAVALGMGLVGCSAVGPTQQERADGIAAQLEDSNIGVTQASAVYGSSFSGDLTVSVTLDDDVVGPNYSMSEQTLKPVIGVIARGAKDMRIGAVEFYAKTSDGMDVSTRVAATALGIADPAGGRSLTILTSTLHEMEAW